MADEVTAPDDEPEVVDTPAVESDAPAGETPTESSASPADGGSAEAAPAPWSRLASMFGQTEPDEEQIIGRMGQFQQTYQQTLRQAEQAAYHQRRNQELEARLQQFSQQAPAPQAPAAPAKPKRETPEYDPEWAKLLKRDEQGNLVAVSGADPLLPQKYQKWANWKAQQEQEFYADPSKYIGQVYQPEVEKLVEERITKALEARFSQQQVNQNAQSFLQQNAYWMLTNDPVTGAEDLTHYGRVFRDALVEADQYQIANPQARQQFAMARVQALAAHQQAQATPAPAEVQARKNAELLKGGAARRPNRSGNVPRVGDEPKRANGDLDLRAMLRRDLAAYSDADFQTR